MFWSTSSTPGFWNSVEVIRLQFWVLIIGLSIVTRVFPTRLVERHCRGSSWPGSSLLVYLENFKLLQVLCNTLRDTAVGVFQDFGSLTNWEKSDILSRIFQWLGIICECRSQLYLPEDVSRTSCYQVECLLQPDICGHLHASGESEDLLSAWSRPFSIFHKCFSDICSLCGVGFSCSLLGRSVNWDFCPVS